MPQCGALKRYSSKVIYDNYNFAVVYIISISCIKIPLAPRTILKLVQLHLYIGVMFTSDESLTG